MSKANQSRMFIAAAMCAAFALAVVALIVPRSQSTYSDQQRLLAVEFAAGFHMPQNAVVERAAVIRGKDKTFLARIAVPPGAAEWFGPPEGRFVESEYHPHVLVPSAPRFAWLRIPPGNVRGSWTDNNGTSVVLADRDDGGMEIMITFTSGGRPLPQFTDEVFRREHR